MLHMCIATARNVLGTLLHVIVTVAIMTNVRLKPTVASSEPASPLHAILSNIVHTIVSEEDCFVLRTLSYFMDRIQLENREWMML